MLKLLKITLYSTLFFVGWFLLVFGSPNGVLAKDGSCDHALIVDRAKNGVVMIKNIFDLTDFSMASGVIVDPRGYIITNNHVIETLDKNRKKIVLVIFRDGKKLIGEVLKVDQKKDLALIKVNPSQCGLCEKYFFAFGGSETLQVSDPVYTIGHPFGFAWTVNHGTIATLPRSTADEFSSWDDKMIQTDTVSNPGNSGGVLITECGAFIGINTLMVPSVHQGNSGIAFAITSEVARNFFREALSETTKTDTEKPKPWLGIKVQEITYDDFQKLAQRNGAITLNSLKIIGVFDQSPAEKTGLRNGDVIVRASDRAFFKDAVDFARYMNSHAVGDTIVLHVVKKDYGSLRMVAVVIESASPEPEIKVEDRSIQEKPTSVLGISFYVLALDPEVLRRAMDINSAVQAHHFMIQEVFTDTPASRANLRIGDIIIAYDGKKTGGIEAFSDYLLIKKEKNEDLRLIILRGEETLKISIQLK